MNAERHSDIPTPATLKIGKEYVYNGPKSSSEAVVTVVEIKHNGTVVAIKDTSGNHFTNISTLDLREIA